MKSKKISDGIIIFTLVALGLIFLFYRIGADNRTLQIVEKVDVAVFYKKIAEIFYEENGRWPENLIEITHADFPSEYKVSDDSIKFNNRTLIVTYDDKVQKGAELIFSPYEFDEKVGVWRWQCGTNRDGSIRQLKEKYVAVGCKQFFSEQFSPAQV